jgi:hypothetical protein
LGLLVAVFGAKILCGKIYLCDVVFARYKRAAVAFAFANANEWGNCLIFGLSACVPYSINVNRIFFYFKDY